MGRKKKELRLIKVNMLGQFSIETPYGKFLESDGRSKKVMLLMGYLIANREDPVSVDVLIQDIWGDQERDDPLNVLKNLVYRARTMLKPLSEDGKFQFICYGKGYYYWNKEAPIQVDTEIFMSKIQEAEKCESSDEERLGFLLEALQGYQGGFLDRFTYNDWVLEKNSYYIRMYLDTVMKAAIILEKEKRYEDVIVICEEAASHYTLDERLHEMLLRAYVATRRFSKALLHYNHITKLFYAELGVSLSNQVKVLYEDIVKSVSSIEMDLDRICSNLDEINAIPSAYYCDYEAFKNIYRLQARVLERTGQAICIALLTFLNQDGQEITDTKVCKQIMQDLKRVALNSLRRGDIVSQFSGTQLVLMLSMTDEKNARNATERIEKNFRKLNRHLDIKIKVNTRSLVAKNKD